MSAPLNHYAKGRSVEQRLFDYFMPEPNSGCWLWLGSLNACGYGTLGINGRSQLAHRVSYSALKGAVEKSDRVLHTCDTPCCVNPDHLWLGTQADNVADMEKKGRSHHPRGEAHGLVKLSDDDVRQIRNDARSFNGIARAYGVTKTTIRNIKRGKTRKTVQ